MVIRADKVWMICNYNGDVWYSPPATNARDAWLNARNWEMFCTGGRPVNKWYAAMKADGWRAKPVTILRGDRS